LFHEGRVSFFLHAGALCSGHWSIVPGHFQVGGQGDYAMDDYQEELLEFQAYELDSPEPAEDATEL